MLFPLKERLINTHGVSTVHTAPAGPCDSPHHYTPSPNLWVSVRTPLLFLPVCPWSSLVNTSAPGIGGPSIFPTPSLWMTSPNYYSCRHHLRVRAFKFHDSPSKSWEEIPNCPLAICKGYHKHRPGLHQPTPWHSPCSSGEPLDPENPSSVLANVVIVT